jgi:hypothetical protein
MYCFLLLAPTDRRVAALLVLFALAQPAFAANKTWVGGPDFNYTDWFDPDMWSPVGVPADADNVVIPEGLDSYPVVSAALTRTGSTTVDAGASLDIDANLTNSGAFSVYGVVSLLAGRTWTNTGSVIVYSNGGYLLLYGTFNHNSSTLTVSGILDLYGIFNNSANSSVNSGGTLQINPSSEFRTTSTFSSTGSLLNYGSFTHTSGTVTNNGTYTGQGNYLSSTFVNPSSGILGVDGEIDDLTFGAGFTNSGAIKFEFRSGDFDKITVTGTATLGGTFTASFPDGVPAVNTQFTVLTATTRTGTFTNSSVNLGGGQYANVSYTSTSVRITVASAPLPIELTRFSAHWQPATKAVQLDWRTAREHNNKGFEVERSTDGVHWQTLGFVAGKGTTGQPQDYLFQDETPTPGLNYYRLRQLDTNGEVNLLKVVTVDLSRFSPLGQVQVFPNPVSGNRLTVNLPASVGEENVVGTLHNSEGLVVRQVVLQPGANSLDVSALSNGLYTLKITQEQQHYTVRVALLKAN